MINPKFMNDECLSYFKKPASSSVLVLESLKKLWEKKNALCLVDAFSWHCTPYSADHWCNRYVGAMDEDHDDYGDYIADGYEPTQMSDSDWDFVEILYKLHVLKIPFEAILLENDEWEESLWV
jgi:hypothetical protein